MGPSKSLLGLRSSAPSDPEMAPWEVAGVAMPYHHLQELARPAGFEPATPASGGRHSRDK